MSITGLGVGEFVGCVYKYKRWYRSAGV